MTNINFAAANPQAARVMDNWFPDESGIRVRGGRFRVATLPSDVESLFEYDDGVNNRRFAADATGIYDATAPADPNAALTPAVSGQTSGVYATENFGTPGARFLYAVNGTDEAQLYDGTTWQAVTASSSPISITGVDTSALEYVWSFKSRLFFVERNSLSVWYLPVDQVGGAATEFPLAGVFSKGGRLIFGGVWSADSGDGLDDRWFVVTDRGQMVIYQGFDPSSPATWSQIGVYDIGEPMGRNAHMEAGGDRVIATREGMVPISEAVRRDPAALSIAAVSRQIEEDWRSEATQRSGLEWDVIKWVDASIALVAMPAAIVTPATEAQCYVVNLQTGAWARWTGWNARCGVEFGRNLYIGVGSGVFEAERGGLDDQDTFTARLSYHAVTFGDASRHKIMSKIRATFLAATRFAPKVSVSVNYQVQFPSDPNADSAGNPSTYGAAIWGASTWGGGVADYVTTRWVSIGRDGFAFAPQVQVTSGSANKLDVKMLSLDALVQAGHQVV